MDAPPVQYVTTSDGYDIAYMVIGSGPAFVWMPMPLNHLLHMWNARSVFFEALSNSCKLVLYDSRGQGLSSRGISPEVGLEDYARDLMAVADAASLDKFALLGQGLVANVA